MTLHSPLRNALGLLLVAGLAAAGLPATAAPEFPPKELKNLKVFPADTAPRDLIDAMKSFSQSLGVRCWFCHVGEEGMNLSEFDFVSDEKKEKKAARLMLQMTHIINGDFMAKTAAILGEDDSPHVGCVTCHRGKAHPEP